jgi:hypothetical protein
VPPELDAKRFDSYRARLIAEHVGETLRAGEAVGPAHKKVAIRTSSL